MIFLGANKPGQIAQWIRAQVSEAWGRGFNSLFAQFLFLNL